MTAKLSPEQTVLARSEPNIVVITRECGWPNYHCHHPRMRVTQVTRKQPFRDVPDFTWVARIRGP